MVTIFENLGRIYRFGMLYKRRTRKNGSGLRAAAKAPAVF
jgi:hypothetical protein